MFVVNIHTFRTESKSNCSFLGGTMPNWNLACEEVGMSNATVSKWCSNTTQPTLVTLDQIARILGVNAKDLINDTVHNQSIQ